MTYRPGHGLTVGSNVLANGHLVVTLALGESTVDLLVAGRSVVLHHDESDACTQPCSICFHSQRSQFGRICSRKARACGESRGHMPAQRTLASPQESEESENRVLRTLKQKIPLPMNIDHLHVTQDASTSGPTRVRCTSLRLTNQPACIRTRCRDRKR